jgi:uncharacterized Zn-binding protein involved in type VI secretion
MTVSVNPPKTPVTEGSSGIAAATVPNVCKMPGPPAPFVPTPLPNIGKSDNSPDGYSKDVQIEGKPVAIKGATFKSLGDIASQGTGGGIVSANVQGETAFVAPGSMDVKIEGGNVQLLGDATTNNGGSNPNAATTALAQAAGAPVPPGKFPVPCKEAPASSDEKMSECEIKQICAKCDELNKIAKQPGAIDRGNLTDAQKDARRELGNKAASAFKSRMGQLTKGKGFRGKKLPQGPVPPEALKKAFAHPCAHKEWMDKGADPKMPGLSADHVHEIQLGGSPTSPRNLKLTSSKANEWMGSTFKGYNAEDHPNGVHPDCCG